MKNSLTSQALYWEILNTPLHHVLDSVINWGEFLMEEPMEPGDITIEIMELKERVKKLEERIARLEELVDEIYVLIRSYL